MKKIVAENLYEYKEIKKLNEEEVNEIFGLSQKEKDQKKSILDLGAKASANDISDEEIKASNESGALKIAVDAFGIQRTAAITDEIVKKIKGAILQDPIKYKQWAWAFLNYAAKLINGKATKNVVNISLSTPKDAEGNPIKDGIKVLSIAGQAGTASLGGRVGGNA